MHFGSGWRGGWRDRDTGLAASVTWPGRGLGLQPPSVTLRASQLRAAGQEEDAVLPRPPPSLAPTLFPPGGPPRTGHTCTGGWWPYFRKSRACLHPHGDFPGKGCGPGCHSTASCSPSAQEVCPSGRDPGAGSSCRWPSMPPPPSLRTAGRSPPLTQLMVGPLSSTSPRVYRALPILS